jgi:hypothetical protein
MMTPGKSGSVEGSGFPGDPLTVKFCSRVDNIWNITWRANVSPAHRRLPGNMTAKQIPSLSVKPPYKLNILLQNTEITFMSEVTFLGMYIKKNFIWQTHIHSLCHSLSKTY